MAREPYQAHGLELIESGLAQRRARPQSLANVIGSPRDAAALAKIFNRAKVASEKLTAMTDGINSAMSEHAEAVENELSKYRGMLSPTELSNQRHRAIAEKRRALLSVGREARAALVAELSECHALAESVREDYQSPVSYLQVRSLSEPKIAAQRAQFQALLANAGESEVKAHVRDAVARGDRALLAACFSRIDALIAADPNARNRLAVNKSETADLLVRQEMLSGWCAIEAASLLVARANVAVAVAESGDAPNSIVRIELGQRQKVLDSLIESAFPEDDPAVSPNPSDRIRNPLLSE